MAAEKLTKGRLTQIMFMLFILIAAFIWRSVTYSKNETLCEFTQDCILDVGNSTVTMKWQPNQNHYQIDATPNNKSLQLDVTQGHANITKEQNHWSIVINKRPVQIKITNGNNIEPSYVDLK